MEPEVKFVSDMPARSDAICRLPLAVVTIIFSILLAGCETLEFFLTPTSDVDVSAPKRSPVPEPIPIVDSTPTSIVETDTTTSDPDPVIQAPEDLWIRMRDDFKLHHHQTSEKVTNTLPWFVGKQTYIERIASRANRYLYYILTRVEQRNLPGELALIPVIESGYQPFAQSPSGAAGLWQFIPSTGRRFNLTQGWWYDGRRDVVAATDAALDYLEYLHAEFEGDWLLAIAAYNAGEGTVRSAIKKNLKANRKTDYWSLKLPRETQRYLPRLLAMAVAVGQPDEFDLEFPPLQNSPYFSIVELTQQIDLALVARFADITMEEVYLLNPAFNRWATGPNGPYRILIPIESEKRFLAALQNTPKDALITWRHHEVLPGQTLSEIAATHHTSVASLQRENQLSGVIIHAGDSLVVPSAVLPLSEYTLSATGRGVIERPAGGEKLTYVVKTGDNLWSIARRHDTRVKKIAAWNGINARGILRPGQKLVIWKVRSPNNDEPLMALSDTSTTGKHYTVQPGDSLWTISRRFGVSVKILRQWNAISEKEYLQPGQKLKVNESNDSIEI